MPRFDWRLAMIAGSEPTGLVGRAGEVAFGAGGNVTRDHPPVGAEMRNRWRVLLADPERAVGQNHQSFGVDAAHVLLQRLAGAVERRFGRGGAQRIGHAVERAAVAILQRDDVGDAEGAVVEQHHAVDRGRVRWRRIDAAVLDLAAGQLDPRHLLHVAARDVGAAVAQRPHHVRRIGRAAERARADADREVQRLAALGRVGADPEQRVVAEIGADGHVAGHRGGRERDGGEQEGWSDPLSHGWLCSSLIEEP